MLHVRGCHRERPHMNVKLVVVEGKPEGKEIPVQTAKFLIGRGAECHLRPNSELISRHHCMFVVDGDRVTLRDLGSTNGTRVNGERIEGEVTIWHEDLVQVGPLGFRMELDPVPSPTPGEARQVAAAAEPAQQAMAPLPGAVIGSSHAAHKEIDLWRAREQQPALPDSSSGVFDDDTELLNTQVEMAGGQETQYDLPVQPEGDTAQGPGDGYVTLESGRKMKVGNAKAKIEKTRDDTSTAAADILRRVMD